MENLNPNQTKICNKCQKILPIDNFYNSKKNRGGKLHACNKCILLRNNKWLELKKKIRDQSLEPKIETKQKCCSACKLMLDMSNFCLNKRSLDGIHSRCKSCQSMNRKRSYIKHREKELKNKRKYRSVPENKKREKITQALWAVNNKKHIRKQAIERKKIRKQTDLNYRMRYNLRERIRAAMKRGGNKKIDSTFKLIGCSIQDLRKYLESKFKDGMTWDNYGGTHGWQIDHIVPCASFDLSKEEEQRKCFHFTNVQPLWAEENKLKWKHIDEKFNNTHQID